jgi:hypothetical protein
MALVYLAYCISGFCPPYYIIYYCCYLIFDFWANIFMIAFPCASDFLTVLRVVGWFYCKSTYLCRMSSADSFSSGETSSTVRSWGPNVGYSLTISLPLVVVGGLVATVVFYAVCTLEDGYYYGVGLVGSDRWVGSSIVILFGYSSGGARVISESFDGCLSCIYCCSVFYRLSTSVYNYIIAPTSFVWFAVCGGISIRF